MEIKVLGTGCAKCVKLHEHVGEALKKAGITASVEKVTDLAAIMGYGVMSTPALVIDGKVVSTGKLLSPAEIIPYLK
jgi:small redox-active disulfide protein 2